MLTAEAIIKKRRNRRERSHTAHGRLGALSGHEEHEKVHAPNEAVLDGFVELGRFL
jgi:hypothetical protein